MERCNFFIGSLPRTRVAGNSPSRYTGCGNRALRRYFRPGVRGPGGKLQAEVNPRLGVACHHVAVEQARRQG